MTALDSLASQVAAPAWLGTGAEAVEPYQLLGTSGELSDGQEAPLGFGDTVRALELMLLSRAFDERATALNRQGRFGGFAPAAGQEACLVGSAMALDPTRDWIVPQYRELPALVHHGYPLERLAAFSLGKSDAAAVPEGVRVLPLQFALAAQLPHAVGLAWGRMLQGRQEVVIAYCGEGATSEGDFHEACNLAAVLRAPIVFFIQNNEWAISTPRRAQYAAPNLAVRALGYGFVGAVVDGNDLFAVHRITSDAVERALWGAGPTLIDAHTYRLGVHNMTDDPSRYRDAEEVAAATGRDPIARLLAYLRARHGFDGESEATLRSQAAERVEAAMAAARAMPSMVPRDVFEHVFERRPAGLELQRWMALLDAGER